MSENNKIITHGLESFSTARKFGDLLKLELKNDPHFYFFSPDETTSNKLDAVYKSSSRLWDLPTAEWDLPESANGRIVELLSENTLFAMMIGHLMNGEPAVMASYEAFYSIIFSQILQQIKFFKQSESVKWRPQYPAVNLLSTSMCWRQDHNGFSHQSPALISALLAVPSAKVNCLFPVDDIAAEANWRFMKKSKNVVNLATFDKNPTPRWLDYGEADALVQHAAAIFDFVSDDKPEIIFTAAGDIATRETLAAMRLLRERNFGHKMRFVCINALTYGRIGTTEQTLSQKDFDSLFGRSLPIFANFHGYPETLSSILGTYTKTSRLHTHGFIEEGSTTTPFEMLTMNHASRFDLAAEVANEFGRPDLVTEFRKKIEENHRHAVDCGTDILVV